MSQIFNLNFKNINYFYKLNQKPCHNHKNNAAINVLLIKSVLAPCHAVRMDAVSRKQPNAVLLELIANARRYAVHLNAALRMLQERFAVMLTLNVSVPNLVVPKNAVSKPLLREVVNVRMGKIVHAKSHVALPDAH